MTAGQHTDEAIRFGGGCGDDVYETISHLCHLFTQVFKCFTMYTIHWFDLFVRAPPSFV